MRSTLIRSTNYKWWAFLAIGFGTFTSVVDHGTIIVALPTIAEHFDTDLLTVQWVMVGYALTISALLMPMGRLSDIIGRRQVYISGFVIFVIGAALAGFSDKVITLILARVLQGCGAAMTQAPAMAMMVSAFPPAERGKALGTHLSVVGVGAIAGPAIGGFLVSALGWRWVFFINIPAGILAMVAAFIMLDNRLLHQTDQRARFDWWGATLSAGTLITFLLAITNGPRIGWESPPIVAAAVGSVALLAAFIWWELRTPAPMLDVRLFKDRLFAVGVTTGFISFLGSTVVMFLMPFYLQSVRGYTPSQLGLIMVPNAPAMIVMGPLSGHYSDRYGWRKFMVAGLIVCTAGLFLLTRITETSSLAFVMLAMILQSAGLGTFNSPNNSSILSTVDQTRYGVVSALIQLVRNSANVTSIAVSTAIVTATMSSMGFAPSLSAVSGVGSTGVFQAFTSGLRTAYLVMGSLVLVAVAISFFNGQRRKERSGSDAAHGKLSS